MANYFKTHRNVLLQVLLYSLIYLMVGTLVTMMVDRKLLSGWLYFAAVVSSILFALLLEEIKPSFFIDILLGAANGLATMWFMIYLNGLFTGLSLQQPFTFIAVVLLPFLLLLLSIPSGMALIAISAGVITAIINRIIVHQLQRLQK